MAASSSNEGAFGPLAVNAADQRRDPDSLLNWMERVIRRRRETPEIGWGDVSVLRTRDERVLAHRCDWEGTAFVGVHNFSGDPLEVRVDLGKVDGLATVVDLLDRHRQVQALDGRRLGRKAGDEIHALADALRGLYLADPDELSALVVVEQAALNEPPGQSTMYRAR